MKNLNYLLITIISALTLGQAQAQDPHAGHSPSTESSVKASDGSDRIGNLSDADMTEGVVKKIDLNQGKVTLKHGEIKSHQMPGMTMVFKVGSMEMLKGLQAGDEVKFALDPSMTVTRIEKK
ncbi:copper-binding protein [Limnobacter humi]|uniref:Copper-binding protein n=1 Tax=Limnobacter humi TaxID=1778671 RepID=A0ABT1WG38_9BURK|nr:copper-binding protein [Limnobacter humi]MCQ8895717.1 copper-binding protein [Limnobacter humi]